MSSTPLHLSEKFPALHRRTRSSIATLPPLVRKHQRYFLALALIFSFYVFYYSFMAGEHHRVVDTSKLPKVKLPDVRKEMAIGVRPRPGPGAVAVVEGVRNGTVLG
ncbi:hypothetical protein C1H76_8823 [Elsinoe australis]|uniref:Uncharacterized protein n=1 Tax=Elsinoe australis TaxID=40998 RepID=A0A4U7ATK1_9PEZI|nr:hypothetical protein C1H76_8823 [Elsinoe australis]